ncbi:MAG: hypothetical protein ACTHN5_23890 [Phycisphaerae bacterium]
MAKRNVVFVRALVAAVSGAVGMVGASWGALPAFPGADGFGGNAVGGRGGFVYHVTNLTDDATTPAAGSLRYGLIGKNWPAGATAETIVFDVGGTIQLSDVLSIKGISNVTIAGQTAPGPGITLMNYKVQVTSSSGTKPTDITSNVVMRYLSVYHGNATGSDDSVGVLGSTSSTVANTHDIILDHITASWGNDENMSVTNDASNVTVSNSFITEPIEAGHQYGSLIRTRIDNTNVSYIGNLYANSKSRNPRPGSYNGDTLNFDFRNNVIYNYSDRAGYTGGDGSAIENVNMNYVGNYIIAGPATPTGAVSRTAFTADNSGDGVNVKIYQSGNKIDSNGAGQTTTGQLTGTQGVNAVRDGTDTGWGMFAEINAAGTTVPLDAGFQTTTAFGYPAAKTLDADTAYKTVLASAGNMPWARNASDARVVNDVKTSTGNLLTGPVAGEWNAMLNQAAVNREAGFDTDGDGMPNSWEKARGLNPNLASDGNGVVTAGESAALAGYTWLEMYLNDLTLQATWSGGVNGSWDSILNWNGQLPNMQDSTAAFGNVGGAAVATVMSSEHVGQLAIDNASGYTFSGSGDLTMDVLNKSGGTGAYATVTVSSGGQTIGVPLNLLSDTRFTVAGGAGLNVTGAFNAAGRLVAKDGAGRLEVANVRAAGLTILEGVVAVSAKGAVSDPWGTSVVGTLAISAGGQLDLGNNVLIVQPTSGGKADALAALRSELSAGAIVGSNLPVGTVLALVDNGTFATPYGSYAGQGTDGNSLIVAVLLPGDANADGKVDLTDLSIVLNHFGMANVNWTAGNFDGATTVDLTDLSDVLNNFGRSMPTGGAGVAAAPEAGTLGILGGAVVWMRRRRG